MAANPQSILDSTKQVLGLDSEYTAYDLDVVMHINTALDNLGQVGVGPAGGLVITDATAQWAALFEGLEGQEIHSCKSYVYLQVRLLFDPPSTSYALAAFQAQLDQLLWRINVRREEVAHP